MNEEHVNPIEILLVEDNEGDIRLIQAAMKENRMHNPLRVIRDGLEAWNYLTDCSEEKLPELIMLDLNLPKIDGRELLQNIKTDSKLKRIPVVILTGSDAENDVLASYDSYANCYITKPLDYNDFTTIIKMIHQFWVSIVKLPEK